MAMEFILHIIIIPCMAPWSMLLVNTGTLLDLGSELGSDALPVTPIYFSGIRTP